MEFRLSDRCADLTERITAFMKECIYPTEPVYARQLRDADDHHAQPPVMEELKSEAQHRDLWNLFHPNPEYGPGLTNLEYAPLAEILGRSPIASEACNCSAPDTGNMEVLSLFGTDEQRERWLGPLLDGQIRSGFAMTEPGVASSDATNIELSIERAGDEYVLNGRKWWTTNAVHPNCRILIVMGKTDTRAPRHRQQSMVLVPLDTPGVEIVRGLTVFGFDDQPGHAEVRFDEVHVPIKNLVGGEGDGWAIAQARLGPGRVHHCMRSIGAAERCLELMCERVLSRVSFGEPLAKRSNIQDWIAESRIDLEMIRLLTLKTAWLMDTVGNRQATVEIAAIKVAAPQIALRVIDRAIQAHGGAGVTEDFPLAQMWAHQRTLRIADGPDEVHKRTIAVRELRRWAPDWGSSSDRATGEDGATGDGAASSASRC